MSINVNVKDTILRSKDVVFDAIIQADKITNYFASRSSGKLVEGENIIWYFDDVGVEFNIRVVKVEELKHIIFEWEASGILARVDIKLKSKNNKQTSIEITESTFKMNSNGIQQALQQTQGWTDFICSLKAFLYTGINLRNDHLVLRRK